ncbi:MAG: efflux RND transporter periplasmic adaptor subunit [Devosia nanyangense]|uniref:Efflux RND transporter periplasmic adaptor subunit n=1 Tax=Devosia nanyangense TaxID=1228055 RepID=A0A933KZE1_9HYPH|nr:efflux RND transporter periplasmic adaptor subunit [Devosia nanyangense]
MLQKADVAEVLAAEAKRSGTSRTAWIAVAAVGAVLLAVVGWMWWSGAFGTRTAGFVTEPAARGDIHVTLVATGTLEPTQQVDVASTVSGTIASVDVDYNQTVVKGQALAHLDMSDLEAKLSRALAMVDVQKASRLSAAASLADAEAALARTEALASGSAVSQRDIDLARTAVQRAEASVASAEAQLKAAEADLQTTRNDYAKGVIAAPIDGIVLDVNVEPGQAIGTASLGVALFSIAADLRSLDLQVDIDEADVARVGEGDAASFTVEASPDKPFNGTIRQIRSAPTVSDGVVSYKALIAVDNAAQLLRPGMTATADIAVDDAIGVLTVPNAALRFSPSATAPSGVFSSVTPKSTIETDAGGEQIVWVLTDGEATAVAVTVGLTDGQRTEITGGELKDGDLVITGNKAG